MKQLLLLLLLTTPAYSQGTVQWNSSALATANTSKTGTSGTISWVYENKETTPQFVDRLVVRATGTNVATALRVFLNNGKAHTEAENNVLFAEETLEATSLDEAAKFADEVVALDIYLPPGARIFCTVGTTVASGYRITAVTKTPTEVTP